MLIVKHIPLHWSHLFVLVTSLLVTTLAWRFSSKQVEGRKLRYFDRKSEYIVERVRERMQKYEDALWAGVAHIHADYDVTEYESWLVFSKSLQIHKKYPGICGIGVIHEVARADKDSYLATQREERPNFLIHPEHQRESLWPICYIEPSGQNSKAVGLDMGFEENRYKSLMKAKKSGEATITGPIVLVQDQGKTPGVLFYLPFYKGESLQENFLGAVYAPIIVRDLLAGSLEREKRLIEFSIHDQDALLYDEHNGSKNLESLRKEIVLDLYGRKWHFDLRSTANFDQEFVNHQPEIILSAGLAVDLLLLYLFVAVSKSKKELELKSKEQESLFSLGLLGLVHSTLDGKILEVNDYVLNAIGYSREEFERGELKWSELTPPAVLEKELEILKALDTEDSVGPYEKQDIHKDGSIVDILIGVSLTDRAKGNATCFILDITDMKKREHEIQNYLITLKAIDEEKDEMISIISHDLKEPLRSISGLASMLEYKSKNGYEKLELEETLADIVSLSKKAKSQIEVVLKYSKVGVGQLSKEEFVLRDLLEELLAYMQFEIENKKAKIELKDLSQTVVGDRGLLFKVFENLLSNALKYSTGQDIQICIGSHDLDGKVQCYVEDNGIGIAEDQQELIFKIFKTVDEENPSSGVGLSIVKKIVALHHGELTVESSLANGTKILFTIGDL